MTALLGFVEFRFEGFRPGGRPKRTWREVAEKDCQPRKLNKDDGMDGWIIVVFSRLRMLIKDVWQRGWILLGECSDTGPPG